MLIREAFLRGISTRLVGRVVGIVTGEVVSAQTVSKLARSLDRLVKAFQQAPLKDEWVYLLLDGVSRPAARAAFRVFRSRWLSIYPAMVKRLERDLPELLTFFSFPRPLWRKLRTTNVIERCFVEVRRRTRPMVCFVNVSSVDRIIYGIFNGMNEKYLWKNRTLQLITQAA